MPIFTVIASDSEAISCDFAPVPVEGDCRVAVNTAPRNDRKKVAALLAMTFSYYKKARKMRALY